MMRWDRAMIEYGTSEWCDVTTSRQRVTMICKYCTLLYTTSSYLVTISHATDEEETGNMEQTSLQTLHCLWSHRLDGQKHRNNTKNQYNGPLFRTTRVSHYQKNNQSLTPCLYGYYTTYLINLFHFLRPTASSLAQLMNVTQSMEACLMLNFYVKIQELAENGNLPNPANPGISRPTCERSTSFPDGATDNDAPSICSGDTSESDSSLASGQSSNAGMTGFLPEEMSFTHGFKGSSCSDASSALRVSS